MLAKGEMIYSPKGADDMLAKGEMIYKGGLPPLMIYQTCGLDKKSSFRRTRIFWCGLKDLNLHRVAPIRT